MGLVKTFSEFINESIWTDMHRISTGEITRNEDIVQLDHLNIKRFDTILDRFVELVVYCENYKNDFDDLIKYIKKNTRVIFNDNKPIKFSELLIPYVKDNWDKFDNVKKHIDELISKEEREIAKLGFKKESGKPIYDTLCTWWDTLDEDTKWKYMLESSVYKSEEESFYNMHHDDEEFTGENLDPDEMFEECYYRELVGFYMDDITTNESIWADMHRVSTGETTRKEDDVNALNDEDFCDYLNNQYSISNALGYSLNISNFDKYGYIRIPIYSTINVADKRILSTFCLYYYSKLKVVCMYKNCKNHVPGLCDALEKNFNFHMNVDHTEGITNGKDDYLIEPLDGDIDNNFVIKVLNFINDNIDERENIKKCCFKK